MLAGIYYKFKAYANNKSTWTIFLAGNFHLRNLFLRQSSLGLRLNDPKSGESNMANRILEVVNIMWFFWIYKIVIVVCNNFFLMVFIVFGTFSILLSQKVDHFYWSTILIWLDSIILTHLVVSLITLSPMESNYGSITPSNVTLVTLLIGIDIITCGNNGRQEIYLYNNI